MKESERVQKILDTLRATYPDAKCSLNYKNPYELLVATVLSAQCTDKRVNEVTPALFKKYPSPEKLAKAPVEDIEDYIRSTGFFRQKAKSLKKSSEILVKHHAGRVPKRMDELIKLPGVGRKTANVILGNAFGKPAGIVVDTHVKRLSYRLGLTKNKDPHKIEIDLNKKIPVSYWVDLPHWLIHHGREICVARKPKCLKCPLLSLCPRKGLPRLSAPIQELSLDPQGEIIVKRRKIRPAARAIAGKKR